MGALEGATALAHGSLVTLSEQNIVDCSGKAIEVKSIRVHTTIAVCLTYLSCLIVPYGNHGCACGDVNNAFLYVIDNDGVDTWSAYPFKSRVSFKEPQYSGDQEEL